MTPSKLPKLLATVFAAASLATLTACATLTSLLGPTDDADVRVTAVACEAFKPITWSARDTTETIVQIREHNAAFVELCGARSGGNG